ncbi:hypothetical protein [Heyndrickxia oleronia]|uniref:hypothetical protein n=1 Tax=Heyndrickxia oleronia TaxID=38875 RepID=UPI001C0F0FA2|nr:hypothetical protein [Heyndrickxia oleronia]MBU5211743.1 hypothetical protein [Heyndrickxia oleronia]
MESNLHLEEMKKKLAQELSTINKQIYSNISSGLKSISAVKTRLIIPSSLPNKILNVIGTKVSGRITKSIDVINHLLESVNDGNQPTSNDNFQNKLIRKLIIDKQSTDIKDDLENSVKSVSTDIKDDLENNIKSVSTEMLESLHELINKQIEVETYSGNVVGELLAIERDYIIVGYTTLIPLQRIQTVKVVEEVE